MEQKIILLKDLDEKTQYPITDILTSEGYRLGCATTAFINWAMRLKLFDPNKFSNVPEMALFYEQEFETDDLDSVKTEQFYIVVDNFVRENQDTLEHFVFRADKTPYEYPLFLLANDFVGLICSQTASGEGHCDIVFRDNGRVFYNCFEVNEEQLADIFYSSNSNMFLFARNLKHHKRLMMKASEMGSLKVQLTEQEKYMLTGREIFFLENNSVAIFEKFPTEQIQDILREKEQILKNTGHLDSSLIILYE